MTQEYIEVPPSVSGGNKIQVVSNAGVNTPVNHICDRQNPEQHVAVSNKGELRVAFDNGAPDFSGFGHMSVSEPNLMGMYKFYESAHTPEFHKVEVGSGTLVRDAVNLGMKATTTTASGDKAGYYSHRHFQYRPGNTMPLMFTMRASDTGKVNLRRRAGWLSENTRICIEEDDTGTYVLVEDDIVGTSVRVEKANWNGDRLDGLGGDSNLSGATFLSDKNSIWWIDFQYLGAGAVRFGTFVDGQKVTCHTIGNYGVLDRPYLSSAALSFGFEQENLGVIASTSEMWVYCVAITNDGYDQFNKNTTIIKGSKTVTTETFVPIMSFRPTELKDGVVNRNRILPKVVSMMPIGAPVEVVAAINPLLVNDTWAESTILTGIGIEYDLTADSMIHEGLPSAGAYAGDGIPSNIDLTNTFPEQISGVVRNYVSTGSDHVTMYARLLAPGSAVVNIALTVSEIE